MLSSSFTVKRKKKNRAIADEGGRFQERALFVLFFKVKKFDNVHVLMMVRSQSV